MSLASECMDGLMAIARNEENLPRDRVAAFRSVMDKGIASLKSIEYTGNAPQARIHISCIGQAVQQNGTLPEGEQPLSLPSFLDAMRQPSRTLPIPADLSYLDAD